MLRIRLQPVAVGVTSRLLARDATRRAHGPDAAGAGDGQHERLGAARREDDLHRVGAGRDGNVEGALKARAVAPGGGT